MKKSWIGLFCLVCAGLFGQEIPYGQEFLLNTDNYPNQENFKITSLQNNRFVVCWEIYDPDRSEFIILGQVYSSDGQKISGLFQIDTYIATNQFYRIVNHITASQNGGFILYWNRFDEDGSRYQVFFQLFSSDGNKVNKEFYINAYREYFQVNLLGPQMISLPNGGFVVCWESWSQDLTNYDVYGQLISSGGEKLGSEFLINTYTRDEQYFPQMTVLTNGNFVVCWQSSEQYGWDMDIFGQIYSSIGDKVNGEFQVNTTNLYSQHNPQIISLPKNNFLVCWENSDTWGEPNGVYGQIFSSEGQKIGEEIKFFNKIGNRIVRFNVTSLYNNNFIVSCLNWVEDVSRYNTSSQLFSSNGIKVGKEFQINSESEIIYEIPQIISIQNGGFFVVLLSSIQGSWILNGQLFSSDGNEIGAKYQINKNPYDKPMHQQIVSLWNDGFVVSWESWPYGLQNGIHARHFPDSPLKHVLNSYRLLQPPNDSSLKSICPVLSWVQPSNQIVCYPWELHYKILLANNPEFSSPQIFEQDQDTTLTLKNLTPGTTYFWKVLAKNIAGDSLWSSNTNAFFVNRDATDVQKVQTHSPNQFFLFQNYPNPFNPETTIRFDLLESGYIDILIYDITGKLVKVLINESRNAGSYSIKWDGKNLAGNAIPSGIYICRMEVKTASGKLFVKSVKMGIVR